MNSLAIIDVKDKDDYGEVEEDLDFLNKEEEDLFLS